MSKLFSNLFGGGKKGKGDAAADAAPLFAANPYAVNAPAAANKPLDDAIAGLLGSSSEGGSAKASKSKRRARTTEDQPTDARKAKTSKSSKKASKADASAVEPAAAAEDGDPAPKKRKKDKGAMKSKASDTDTPSKGDAAQGGEPSGAAADATPEGEAEDVDTTKAPAYTDEQLTRTVFVGNVPADIDKDHLKAFFTPCGKVETVRLRTVPVMLDSKMPKHLQIKAGKIHGDRASATAFVRFESVDSLPAALVLNMTVLKENHVRVDRAAPPSAKQAGGVQYDSKRSVFVGNLAFDVKEEDLIRIFNSGALEPRLLDAVEAVRVVKDVKTNVGKGIAYVLFTDKVAALAALNLNDKPCKGRKMRVTRVKATAGGANGTKVAGGRTPGKSPYVKGQKTGASTSPADWQGARTKGAGKTRTKALRSTEGGGVAKSTSSGVSSAARSGGKRPAVLARKAAQLAKLGRITESEASAVAKSSAKRQKNSKAKAKASSKKKPAAP